jgi:hypothetical protein
MTAPKMGETVRYLRTGDLFEVRKVANGFVILHSKDGSSQIMTGAEGFDLYFRRTWPMGPRQDFNSRSTSAFLARGPG